MTKKEAVLMYGRLSCNIEVAEHTPTITIVKPEPMKTVEYDIKPQIVSDKSTFGTLTFEIERPPRQGEIVAFYRFVSES